MSTQVRVIRRPALLGVLAMCAIAAAMAASWSLAARAESLRPGWGIKASLIPFKAPDDTDTSADVDAGS